MKKEISIIIAATLLLVFVYSPAYAEDCTELELDFMVHADETESGTYTEGSTFTLSEGWAPCSWMRGGVDTAVDFCNYKEYSNSNACYYAPANKITYDLEITQGMITFYQRDSESSWGVSKIECCNPKTEEPIIEEPAEEPIVEEGVKSEADGSSGYCTGGQILCYGITGPTEDYCNSIGCENAAGCVEYEGKCIAWTCNEGSTSCEYFTDKDTCDFYTDCTWTEAGDTKGEQEPPEESSDGRDIYTLPPEEYGTDLSCEAIGEDLDQEGYNYCNSQPECVAIDYGRRSEFADGRTSELTYYVCETAGTLPDKIGKYLWVNKYCEGITGDAEESTVFSLCNDRTECGAAPKADGYGEKYKPFPVCTRSGSIIGEWACANGQWSKCEYNGQAHCNDDTFRCAPDYETNGYSWVNYDDKVDGLLHQLFNAGSDETESCKETYELLRLYRGEKEGMLETEDMITYSSFSPSDSPELPDDVGGIPSVSFNDNTEMYSLSAGYADPVTRVIEQKINSITIPNDGFSTVYTIDLKKANTDFIEIDVCNYKSTGELCGDSADSDGDGLVDCDDPDCDGSYFTPIVRDGSGGVCHHIGGDGSSEPISVVTDLSNSEFNLWKNYISSIDGFWSDTDKTDDTYTCKLIDDDAEWYVCVNSIDIGDCKTKDHCSSYLCAGKLVEDNKYTCYYNYNAEAATSKASSLGLTARAWNYIDTAKYDAFVDEYDNHVTNQKYIILDTAGDMGWISEAGKGNLHAGYECIRVNSGDDLSYFCYWSGSEFTDTECKIFDCSNPACEGTEQSDIVCYHQKRYGLSQGPEYLEVNRNLELFAEYLGYVISPDPKYDSAEWQRLAINYEERYDTLLREWMAEHLPDEDENNYADFCVQFSEDSSSEWYICTAHDYKKSVEDCNSQLDEDGDGLAGCEDPDCAEERDCRCTLNNCEVSAGNYFSADLNCFDRSTSFLYCGTDRDDASKTEIRVKPASGQASCIGHSTSPSYNTLANKYVCEYIFCGDEAAETTRAGTPHYTMEQISFFESYDLDNSVNVISYENSVTLYEPGLETLANTGCHCDYGYFANLNSMGNVYCSEQSTRLNPEVAVYDSDGNKLAIFSGEHEPLALENSATIKIEADVSDVDAISKINLIVDQMPPAEPSPDFEPHFEIRAKEEISVSIEVAESADIMVESINTDGTTGSSHIMIQVTPTEPRTPVPPTPSCPVTSNKGHSASGERLRHLYLSETKDSDGSTDFTVAAGQSSQFRSLIDLGQYTEESCMDEMVGMKNDGSPIMEESCMEVDYQYTPGSFEWDFDCDGQVDQTTTNRQDYTTYTYDTAGTYYIKVRAISEEDSSIYSEISNKVIVTAPLTPTCTDTAGQFCTNTQPSNSQAGSGDCDSGSCYKCGQGYDNCGAICVNLLTDNSNCGSCFNECNTQAGKSCKSGTCCSNECTQGTAVCSDENTRKYCGDNNDGDGCLDWVYEECPEDCENGACASADRDSDSDGVDDSVDACPTTPAAYHVKSDGCTTPGDTDGNNCVNGYDVSMIAPNINLECTHGAYTRHQGDIDGDGCVKGYDVSMIAPNIDLSC